MNEADFDSKKEGVVLSGMRPTGELHIGHFEGVLRNWVELQNTHRSFYFVADWHALTTELDTTHLQRHTLDMVKDWLAFGVDPEKSTIFVQSYVPQHAELGLILERLINIGALERMPSFKDQLNHLSTQSTTRDENGQILTGEDAFRRLAKEKVSAGFLNYPVLQSADILLYGATHVPVGEDQLPHLELTREIARRFNYLYKKSIFVEPQALLSHVPKVSGIDGRKMSKSYGNTIDISEEEELLKKKIKTMFTDPLKIKANDPGHPRACAENPKGCSVFSFHEIYEESKEKNQLREKSCKEGSLGCVQCKNELFQEMNQALKPLREKRDFFSKEKGEVNQILKSGSQLASSLAGKTLTSVREAIQYHEAL